MLESRRAYFAGVSCLFRALRYPLIPTLNRLDKAEVTGSSLNGVVAREDVPAVTELRSHSQRPVSATGLLVDISDLTGQPDPPEGPRRVRTIFPRVIPGLRHTKRDARLLHVDSLPDQRLDHR